MTRKRAGENGGGCGTSPGCWRIKIALIVAGVVIFFGSGAGNPLIRRFVVRRLEAITGGKVEVRTISIRWLSLEATLKGLVIHGREPAGTEALFAAEEIRAGLRVDSFWGRRVSLNDLLVREPHGAFPNRAGWIDECTGATAFPGKETLS